MLYIVRGIPGSGKSYFCQNHLMPYLESLGHKVEHWENDMYFIDPYTNDYCWHPDGQYGAIRWCQSGVRNAFVQRHCDDVIVSNTFVKMKDYLSYKKMAEELGQMYMVLICDGDYQNVHGVPVKTVERMRAGLKWHPGEQYAYKYLEQCCQPNCQAVK